MTLKTGIRLRNMKREDFCFRSFIFSFLSHRKHRTVKGVQVNKVRVTEVMLNPNPMSSSKDNESKPYPELDESVLLVAQAKLPHVFEIRPLDMCRFLSDPGSFQTYQVGLPLGYK